ncbi:sugar-binding transcriptional regulator [Cohaesibacter celericrescens]|uniref:DNA-binding transcriptional regulator n=1 Tax=Cohaesibacter celericrescens TaxID=2067669 RepID=A0A2N5XN18_9HYPH|nr:sugar-binding transcriptional regulator [Cohaesibacter celericrescens]PLW75946.1 DNA-binding transcriptional regulator [Cohaesibacter celericrescens]
MVRNNEHDKEQSPMDLAARAAWLSFVGGLTQDQIANELGISRQRAQRLVARAGTQGLIHVRIEHKIADCLELERSLKNKFDLKHAWVSPGLGAETDALTGLAPFAANIIEHMFATTEPQCFAVGTGRTLRMMVKHIHPVNGSVHKLVSLIGNVAPDGSASMYEAIMRLAEKTSSKYYPMPAPVIAQSLEERDLYVSLPHVKATKKMAEGSDLAIVGIGQMGEKAPLFLDGFLTKDEHQSLQAAGAVGEICGQVFDKDGLFIDHPLNQRVVSTRVGTMPVYCIAAGEGKIPALRAALKGGLLTGLITDEHTAIKLLTD